MISKGFKVIEPIVIAEIGCNHKGDINIAKKMIEQISLMGDVNPLSKINCIKFQKRTNKILLSPKEYNAPHPVPENSYGKTYGEHREFLEFSYEQHLELKKYCEKFGLIYSCSVWDIEAAKEITSLHPKMIKIPSASNMDFEILNFLCDNYEGEIHVSLGMTNKSEEMKIVDLFKKKHRQKDLVLYACTSGYPVPAEDVCLLEIKRLNETYGKDIKGIGFSGPHLGIAIDIGALTLGAKYFERHFTLDRTWKGTDHAASLEPDGLRKLARDLRTVDKALAFKPNEILDVEISQRQKLKRRVVL